jgi:toxin CptA
LISRRDAIVSLGWTWILAAALALCAGFALQRGGICAVLAVRDVIRENRWARFSALLECAVWASIGLLSANALGLMSIGAWPTPASVMTAALGGAIFGLGAATNGACAFGSVGRLAAGEISFLMLPPAFVVGVVIARRVGLAWRAASMAFGISGAALGLLIAALVIFAAWRIWTAARGIRRSPTGALGAFVAPTWPPALAMAIIAFANIGLLLLVANWPYTTLLVDVATGRGMENLLRALLVLTFVAGAVIGATSAGAFALRGADLGDLALRAGGGIVMGVGAAMIPGGNDALVLVGLPLLQFPALAAYAGMVAAITLCLGLVGATQFERSR